MLMWCFDDALTHIQHARLPSVSTLTPTVDCVSVARFDIQLSCAHHVILERVQERKSVRIRRKPIYRSSRFGPR